MCKTLIFIPTYNERENVARIYEQLVSLQLGADILFLDDNSPDGTGQVLDELAKKTANLFVIHRPGKLGVGSAHLDGIAWAYERGYARLITLDCDFTHSPSDILKLLEHADNFDIVLGSRFLEKNSLPEWTIYRRFMTHFGHFLTRHLLKIKQDATGAFRIYRLAKIPREIFSLVKSRGYSFFFESLFLLGRNGFAIKEVPIVLPTRTYGSSKMSARDVWRSVQQMLSLFWNSLIRPAQFRISRPFTEINPKLIDPQNWDNYWNKKNQASSALYEFAAEIYRTLVIRRRLNTAIKKTFSPGASLLHAGCGSGQVDSDIQQPMKITAVDISPAALKLYQQNVPQAAAVKHATIFCLPFPDGSFDGVYNLGVMEHFTETELARIFAEFYRVLRPQGKLVLFWPHHRASSVMFLNFVHGLLNTVLRKNVRLHPPEISLLKSKGQIGAALQKNNFSLLEYSFGPKDFFVQAVIVAKKSDGGRGE